MEALKDNDLMTDKEMAKLLRISLYVLQQRMLHGWPNGAPDFNQGENLVWYWTGRFRLWDRREVTRFMRTGPKVGGKPRGAANFCGEGDASFPPTPLASPLPPLGSSGRNGDGGKHGEVREGSSATPQQDRKE